MALSGLQRSFPHTIYRSSESFRRVISVASLVRAIERYRDALFSRVPHVLETTVDFQRDARRAAMRTRP